MEPYLNLLRIVAVVAVLVMLAVRLFCSKHSKGYDGLTTTLAITMVAVTFGALDYLAH